MLTPDSRLGLGAAPSAWPPAGPTAQPVRSARAGQRLQAMGLDELTGLPDRRAFLAQVQGLQAAAGPLTLLALDLDRFTELNEQHGLASGDAVLYQVARRCLRVAADSGGRCVVARVGADEFALAVAPPVSRGINGAAAHWLAELEAALLRALQPPYLDASGQAALTVTAAIGAARLAPADDAAMALVHAATARRRGGPLVHDYDAQHDERCLLQALREAIADDRLHIALQPKLNLGSGQPCGLEVLARWTLPDGQVVPPDVFIPLAERHGLVCALGERVLERSLALLAQWRDAGLPLLPLAVNFAAPQFHRPDTCQHVARALARHGLPASLLELELTESMLLTDAEGALQTLQALRALGVQLAIDDFGTGYSSLTYLRRFPVQRLKIDRSFISALGVERGAEDIVQMLVQLARRLNLVCLAEGIETPAQRVWLQAIGCAEGQGYLLSRPLSAEACGEWLREQLGTGRAQPIQGAHHACSAAGA